MGLAASSYNLLRLTQRKNDVGYKLAQLATDKIGLSRDMSKVTKEYQEAMNKKVLKWTNNGGVDYIDMSYANLMYPGTLNNNELHMLTDKSGKVVVDDKYKKYAEIISPDGTPGDWESNKAAILSDLTGVSQADIVNADGYYFAFLDNKAYLEEIDYAEPNKDGFKVDDNRSKEKLLEKITGSCGGISNWKTAYGDETQTISKSSLCTVMETLKNTLGKYFMDDKEKFEKACDSVTEWTDDTITVKTLINKLLGNYKAKGGTFKGGTSSDPNTGSPNVVWYDLDSQAYQKYKTAHDTWKAQKEEAERNMNASLSAYNQLFSADEKAKIDFYDELFSAIAENGWKYYDQASDANYVNQMLQNGMFNLTTVDRTVIENRGTYRYENDYNTDIALNCTNVVQMTDSEYRDDALVKYQRQKSIISMKESRIDTRMKDLETEQAAIKQMIEGVKSVMNNNIETHFNIFSA